MKKRHRPKEQFWDKGAETSAVPPGLTHKIRPLKFCIEINAGSTDNGRSPRLTTEVEI